MEATSAQAVRLQWLVDRQQGIGGSDAAALFGVNPFQSPFALYQSKVTKVIDDSDTPAQYWGRKLEPVVREAYAELVDREVGPGAVLAKHPELTFMLANTDGTIAPVEQYDGEGVYEGKTTNVFNAGQWDEGVPLYYQVQVQHYLSVLDLQWASVAVLVLGARDPFKWADVPRNESFISALQEREHSFWYDYVEPRVPPPTDGTKATKRALGLLYPKDNGRVIILPPQATEWDRKRKKIAKVAKVLEERKAVVDNALRAAIADHSYGAILDEEGDVVAGYSFRARKDGARSLRAASHKTVGGVLRDQLANDEED